MKNYVIVLDDNCATMERAQKIWEFYNIDLHGVKDARTAITEIKIRNYVMMIMVAEYLGDSLFPSLRIVRSTSTIPILVQTTAYCSKQQIDSISSGADLYITLPDSTTEYVVAGMALVRRYLEFNKNTTTLPLVLEHNGLLLYVDHHKVFVLGQEVTLTAKEYRILLLLLENKHRVLTYNQIYRNIWGEEYVGDSQRVIDNMVSTLKKKIQVDEHVPEHIKTMHGVGYKFDPYLITSQREPVAEHNAWRQVLFHFPQKRILFCIIISMTFCALFS